MPRLASQTVLKTVVSARIRVRCLHFPLQTRLVEVEREKLIFIQCLAKQAIVRKSRSNLHCAQRIRARNSQKLTRANNEWMQAGRMVLKEHSER